MDSVPIHVSCPSNAGALVTLHVRSGAEAVVISASGDLDRSTAPALQACLNRLLDSDATPAILTIDLARTAFMDVGALNVLLAAAHRAGTNGRALRLVGCNPLAIRLIRTAGANDAFDAVADRRQDGAPAQSVAKIAHTDLPVGSSRTPQAADRPSITCSPRPRWAVRSTGRGAGIGQG
jgi:anti-anti-sigma factor